MVPQFGKEIMMITTAEAQAAHDLALVLEEERLFTRHQIHLALRGVRIWPAAGPAQFPETSACPWRASSGAEATQPGSARGTDVRASAGFPFTQGVVATTEPHKLPCPGATPGPAPICRVPTPAPAGAFAAAGPGAASLCPWCAFEASAARRYCGPDRSSWMSCPQHGGVAA